MSGKKDRELRASYKDKDCLVCGSSPCDPDHIKTFATRLKDEPRNIWPLCRKHHVEKHTIGLNQFVQKYNLSKELEGRGFTFESHKWWLEDAIVITLVFGSYVAIELLEWVVT